MRRERQTGGPGACDAQRQAGTVFAPRRASAFFGRDPDRPDMPLVHVSHVRRGKCGLVCPDCGSPLVARKGDKRVHHLAHRAAGMDNAPSCEGAGETAAHHLAKSILEQGRRVLLPAVKIQGSRGARTVQQAREVSFDQVVLEEREDRIRPDLKGAVVRPDGTPVWLMIEIRVTHAVDEAKRDRIRGLGLSCVEIDLSGIGRAIDSDELERLVLTDAPRHWIHHVRGANAQAESDRAERRRIADREKQAAARKAKAAREVERKQERERRAAERRRREEEEIAQAIAEPPRGANEADLARATRELRGWRIMGLIELVAAAPSSGLFDVETQVWVTRVLEAVAPWRSHDAEGARSALDDPEGRAVADLQGAGFVKPALRLSGPGKQERAEEMLRAACRSLLDHMSAVDRERHQVGGPVAVSRMRERLSWEWKQVLDHASGMGDLAEDLDQQGLALVLDPGGPVGDRRDLAVFAYLAGAASPLSRKALDDLLFEVRNGHPRYEAPCSGQNLAASGLAILEAGESEWPGDAAGRTEASLDRIRARHRDRLSRILEGEADEIAERLLSVFRGIVRRAPVASEVVSGGPLSCLLDGAALREVLRVDPDMGTARPLTAAREIRAARVAAIERGLDHAARLLRLVDCFRPAASLTVIEEEWLAHALGGRTDLRSWASEGLGDIATAARYATELDEIMVRRAHDPESIGGVLRGSPTGETEAVGDALLTGRWKVVVKGMAELRSQRILPRWAG